MKKINKSDEYLVDKENDHLRGNGLTESTLPILAKDEEVGSSRFYEVALEFQKLMMIYESAIKQIVTKLEILNKEYKVTGRRNPIETIKSRIKSPESIAGKLQKKNLPFTFKTMTENLSDIAGVRVICPYVSDIYRIREILLKQPDVKLAEEKDYISSPKPSGYRSLHLVVQTKIYLSNTEHNVPVEIQLRTIAMDFWASLEHELRYKTEAHIPESIRRELFRCAETIAMTDREMEEIAVELQALD
jgi:putative GTP pyrophosphokinase